MSHRSLLNGDDEPKTLPYAITLICSNGADAGHTGAVLQSATFMVYDSATGDEIGMWTSASLESGGILTVSVSSIETDLGFIPESGQFHINFELDETFGGFATHLVDNLVGGVLTNMTDKCAFSDSTEEDAGSS